MACNIIQLYSYTTHTSQPTKPYDSTPHCHSILLHSWLPTLHHTRNETSCFEKEVSFCRLHSSLTSLWQYYGLCHWLTWGIFETIGLSEESCYVHTLKNKYHRMYNSYKPFLLLHKLEISWTPTLKVYHAYVNLHKWCGLNDWNLCRY